MRRLLHTFILGALLALCSCDGDFTYSEYPCFLVIHNETHMDATLASAMNAVSPGVFCAISLNKAANGFVFENNHGLTSTKKFNAVDQRTSHHLGMNNGLIVGYGTMTGSFHAYDRQCPECYDANAIGVPSRPLTMNTDGTAYCPVCKYRYDMNNSGICINPSYKGQKGMTRYRCNAPTPFGTLNVGN